MALIVFHVGMPKTATTTIQRSLARAAPQLRGSGVLYPVAGRYSPRAVNHNALFIAATPDAALVRTPLAVPRESFARMAAGIAAEIDASGAQSVILSSEMLWNPPAFDRSVLEIIRRAFAGHRMLCLAYLRPVAEHAASSFAQRVTGPQRYGGDFPAHLREQEEMGTYRYAERLDDFAAVFGEGSVEAVWLPDLSGRVLAPLARFVPPLAEIAPVRAANRRAAWPVVALTRRMNAMGLPRHLARAVARAGDALIRSSGGSGAQGARFDPLDAERQAALDRVNAENLSRLVDRGYLPGGPERAAPGRSF